MENTEAQLHMQLSTIQPRRRPCPALPCPAGSGPAEARREGGRGGMCSARSGADSAARRERRGRPA
ncbi:hypothetical protein U0070_014360 [Myodes glareolus]|uniref:Uncharacterized protein n=1 Tax=Myodes glareolus TaxID=447135 RepID=A0AAW0IRR7_MYOGA